MCVMSEVLMSRRGQRAMLMNVFTLAGAPFVKVRFVGCKEVVQLSYLIFSRYENLLLI